MIFLFLRNLFFRICALLRRNIKPIFVSEGNIHVFMRTGRKFILFCKGEPPEIKRETIKNRQNARFGRNKDQSEKLNKPEKLIKRKKFGACLKEVGHFSRYFIIDAFAVRFTFDILIPVLRLNTTYGFTRR